MNQDYELVIFKGQVLVLLYNARFSSKMPQCVYYEIFDNKRPILDMIYIKKKFDKSIAYDCQQPVTIIR